MGPAASCKDFFGTCPRCPAFVIHNMQNCNLEYRGRHSAVVLLRVSGTRNPKPKPKTLNEELSPAVYAARASADVFLGDYEQASPVPEASGS